MTEHAEGTFEVTSWNEDQLAGLDETVKVTRATFGQRFAGGIEADTVTDTVMTYIWSMSGSFLSCRALRISLIRGT